MKHKIELLNVVVLSVIASLICNCTDPIPEVKPEPTVTQPIVPQEEAAYINLDNGQGSSVSVGYDRNEFPISFTTNKKWTAEVSYGSNASQWLSLSSTNGSAGKNALIVTVSNNEENLKRSAIISIKAGETSVSVIVSQDAFETVFSITPKSIEADAGGGTFEVSVTSNIGYHASTSVDWIHEMSTKAAETKTLWFVVDANESSESRSGVIVICNDNEVCIPVTVNQDGQPAEDIFLELGAYTLEFDHQERCSQVKVTSNESWSAVSSASWCTAAKIASGNYLDVCVKANDTGKKRTAQITVKTDKGDVKKTLTVSQSPQEGNEDFGDDGQIKWD